MRVCVCVCVCVRVRVCVRASACVYTSYITADVTIDFINVAD